VADFGIAMLLDAGELRQSGGTPDYMAPEAFSSIQDPAIIQRRDVFSLAVMAYEFLVGARPFASQTLLEFVTTSREAPVPATQLRADLPAALDKVILAALDPDPYTRTPTAALFRKELEAARRSLSERRSSARFLLVDHDATFTAFVEQALMARFPGACFTHCRSGGQALQSLSEQPADMVLLDLGLPDINGVELTAEIRARHPAWKMPILIVTALGSAADWKLCSDLGADGFMVKPVELKSLGLTVAHLLDEARVLASR
jgi:serine/threonine-protein kinase